MAKIQSNGHGNWKKDDEEHAKKELLSGILAVRTADEKGHYERQNVKFPPSTIQKLATVMSEKIRPECRTIHDLIRGYVEMMANWDIMEKGIHRSELTQMIAKMLQHNAKRRDEQAMIFTLQREVEEIFDSAKSTEEAQDRIADMQTNLPLKLQRIIQKMIKNVKSDFCKGKNKKGVPYSRLYLMDEESENSGDMEERFL